MLTERFATETGLKKNSLFGNDLAQTQDTIENFCNKIRMGKAAQATDDFMIISVGELNKNKNHQVIIRAIAKLKNKKIKYVLCGQGPLENKLKKLAQELNVERQVKFLGFRKDIPELMHVADLFAFPSFREGLSLSLMEAMASGLPVVCSKIRSNVDLIKHEKGGYLEEATNLIQISNSISKLYDNKILRDMYAKFNKHLIEKYSINSVINKVTRLYKER